MYFLWYILLGLVVGFIANLTSSGRKPGLLINLITGAVGAILGGWIISVIGLVPTKAIGTLITAFFGAVVLLWIVAGIYSKKNSKEKPSNN